MTPIEALKYYGNHLLHCSSLRLNSSIEEIAQFGECTCGFSEALAQAERNHIKPVCTTCGRLDNDVCSNAFHMKRAEAQAEQDLPAGQSAIPDDLQTAVSRGLRLAGFSFTVDTMLTVAREVHGLLGAASRKTSKPGVIISITGSFYIATT